MSPVDVVWKLLGTIVGVFLDLLTFLQLTLRTPQAVAAENLFLRKQLALYVERKTKPHRATDAVRLPWPNFLDYSIGAMRSQW